MSSEVVKLRVGIARVAQKLGCAEHIPGKPAADAPFEALTVLAQTHDTGWHALLAHLMDAGGHKCPAARGEYCPGNRGDW